MEAVNANAHITDYNVTTDIATGEISVTASCEGAVDGELDGMARLRHGGHRSPHDDAVRAAGDGLNAVLAPQLVFVDGFEARHADHVVHVIALFPQRVGGSGRSAHCNRL